jgi:hypothetical protein
MSKYCGSGCRIQGVWSLIYATSTACQTYPPLTCSALTCLTVIIWDNDPQENAVLPKTSRWPTGRSQIPNPGVRDASPSLIGHGGPCLIVPWRLSTMYKYSQSLMLLHPTPYNRWIYFWTLFLNALFERSFWTLFFAPFPLRSLYLSIYDVSTRIENTGEGEGEEDA